MNKIEFMQTGGFPLELDILNVMQDDYSNFNDIGHIIGNKAIVKGCVTTGSTVTDGTIYYNGEFLKFVGGIEQSTFLIRETTETKEFQNGDIKIVFKNKYAEFGTGVDAIDWADLKRPVSLLSINDRLLALEAKTNVLQAGVMLFWNKPHNQIPTGWQEATNWRGRMPVGVDANQAEFATLGIEGGEKEVTLTEQQIPSHHHDGDTEIEPAHKHEMHFPEFPNAQTGGPGYDGGNNTYIPNIWRETTPKGEHGHHFTTNNSGGDQAHNNMSPYRTVYYIEPIN